jgi:MOSC domain-containing protein YiiM
VRIEGVQVGEPALVNGVRTAFGKRAVSGMVRVGRLNLDGDSQANRRYHGGPDMAVLAYSADHYRLWRSELAWPDLPLGAFGENLSVSGATEETVCIGDLWATAGSAILQVASPRKPCRKISGYWGRSDLLQRVQETGRIGWYLRVIAEGALEAGARISLLERPHPEWPIHRAFSAALARKGEKARALSEVAALSDRWKAWLRGEPARV